MCVPTHICMHVTIILEEEVMDLRGNEGHKRNWGEGAGEVGMM